MKIFRQKYKIPKWQKAYEKLDKKIEENKKLIKK